MKKKKKDIPVETSFKTWRRSRAYVQAYDALDDEFALAAALIDARSKAGMSQDEVAKRMRTSQPAIARLEGGGGNPSLATLRRYAMATGTRVDISFKPARKQEKQSRVDRRRAVPTV